MKMLKYLNKRIFVCLCLALIFLILASFVASSGGDKADLTIREFEQEPRAQVTKEIPINFTWAITKYPENYLAGINYSLKIQDNRSGEIVHSKRFTIPTEPTTTFAYNYLWPVPSNIDKGNYTSILRVPYDPPYARESRIDFAVVETLLVIQKYNDTNQNNEVDIGVDEELQGWGFHVKDPSGETKNYKTDKFGEKRIVVPEEYAGKSYTIEETLPPGWKPILPKKQTVRVSKGETTTVQFLNGISDTILIIRKFDDTNRNDRIDGNDKRLQGWEFKVIDPDRNTKTYTTNIKGEIEIKVPPEYGGKEYTIEEILQRGWKSILPVKQPVKVPVPEGKTTTVQFLNQPTETKLIIQKFDDSNRNNEIDSNDDDDERLQGWEFKVIDPDRNTKTYSTNINGEIEIEVPPEYGGKEYNIEEILRPGWKSILPVKQPVKVPVPEGKTTTVQFLNSKILLIIQKFNDTNQNNRIDSSDERLKDWNFNITDPAGKTSTHITNDAGEIRIVVPEEYAGKEYTIEETLQPKWKLVLPIEQPVHVKVPMGETKTVQFLNKELITRLRIQKFDDSNRNSKVDEGTDDRLEGWNFTVTDPAGKLTTDITNNKGEIIIVVPEEYVNKDYTVEEELKDGWKAILPKRQTVKVPKGKTTTVQFLNEENVTLLIIRKFSDSNQSGKVDSEDERLQGWEFKVTDPAGKTTTHITNDIGEIVIKVPREYEGKDYIVKETLNKPDWVAVLPIEQRVNVPKGETTPVNFLNKIETGNLTIIKFYDPNQNEVQDPGDQGLAWNFTIKFPDGSVKRNRTDENGSYLRRNIPVGNYEITEEPRGCRWTNSTDMTQKVEVKGGQETIAQFRNYIAECCILPGCVWKNSDENIEVCKSVDPCSVALGKEEEEVTVHLGLCVDPKHIINGTKVENISVIDTLHSQFTIVNGSFSKEPKYDPIKNPDGTTTIRWDISSLCCEEWNVSFNVTVAFALPIDVTDTSERITSKVIYEDPIEKDRRELSIPEGTLKFIPQPPIWCYVLGGLLVISISIEITLELKRRKKEKPKEKE